MKPFKAISEKPSDERLRFASKAAAEQVERIDREGGDYSAGVICGVSAITQGEALGHGLWIDEVFLSQIIDSGKKKKSVKVHYTHPGLSNDGLGTLLGRYRNYRMSEDERQVLGDLHFVKSAHKAPDGDLAGYIMDVAEETPDLIATSIAFQLDLGAMKAFEGEHSDEDGVFTSPDKENTKDYSHARLAELFAVDLVDEPAANPNGLFCDKGNALPAQLDAALAYAFGISDKAPEDALFGIHPERAKEFLRGFMDRHNISAFKLGGLTTSETPRSAPMSAPWLAKQTGYCDQSENTQTTDGINEAALKAMEQNPIDDELGEMLEITQEEIEAHITKGEKPMKDLTLEALTKERPDLVSEIENAARKGLCNKDDAETAKLDAVNEAKTQERERCMSILEVAEERKYGKATPLLKDGLSLADATNFILAAKLDEVGQVGKISEKIGVNADGEKAELQKADENKGEDYEAFLARRQTELQEDGKLNVVEALKEADREWNKMKGDK